MTDKETLRMSILSQSNPLGSKRRFGLFSQPISTAVGDDGAFRVKIHPRNEAGKPQTEPRNIYVTPLKSGKGKSSFFGPLNTLANHQRRDIFMQQAVRLLKQQHKSFSTNKPQTSFFPIAGIKPIMNSSYEYIQQKNPQLDPKRFKMEDGRVNSGPKNFYTNPQSRVEDTIFKHYKYIQDPFDRKHSKELEEMKKSKTKEHQEPFSPNSFAPSLLNSHQSVYGIDRQIAKSTHKELSLNIMKHQSSWRPSSPTKQGLNGYFFPVHKYIQNPPPERKVSKSPKNEKDAFKGMGNFQTTPTPSISLNRVNMMKSINRSMNLRR